MSLIILLVHSLFILIEFSHNSQDIHSKWHKELTCSFLSASLILIQTVNPRQKQQIHQIMSPLAMCLFSFPWVWAGDVPIQDPMPLHLPDCFNVWAEKKL